MRTLTFGEKEDLQDYLKEYLRKKYHAVFRVSWHPDHLRIHDEATEE